MNFILKHCLDFIFIENDAVMHYCCCLVKSLYYKKGQIQSENIGACRIVICNFLVGWVRPMVLFPGAEIRPCVRGSLGSREHAPPGPEINKVIPN